MNHTEPHLLPSTSRHDTPFRRFGVWLVAFLVATLPLPAEDFKMPAPVKEHGWLKKFVGEWESDIEMSMGPGQPVMKAKGMESSRLLGGFWLLAESKGNMMGMPFASQFTLGFDPDKKKYVGTWIDSSSSYLWKYEGSVDATGKILTLDTEGPSPMEPGKKCKFREVTEFKSDDERLFTSSLRGDDGKWNTILTMTTRRKK